MKVSIEIVDGKVSIQVDDDQPIIMQAPGLAPSKKIDMPADTVLVRPETERGGVNRLKKALSRPGMSANARFAAVPWPV